MIHLAHPIVCLSFLLRVRGPPRCKHLPPLPCPLTVVKITKVKLTQLPNNIRHLVPYHPCPLAAASYLQPTHETTSHHAMNCIESIIDKGGSAEIALTVL